MMNSKERQENLINLIGQSLTRQGKASVMVKGKVSHSAVIAHLIEKSAKELKGQAE